MRKTHICIIFKDYILHLIHPYCWILRFFPNFFFFFCQFKQHYNEYLVFSNVIISLRFFPDTFRDWLVSTVMNTSEIFACFSPESMCNFSRTWTARFRRPLGSGPVQGLRLPGGTHPRTVLPRGVLLAPTVTPFLPALPRAYFELRAWPPDLAVTCASLAEIYLSNHPNPTRTHKTNTAFTPNLCLWKDLQAIRSFHLRITMVLMDICRAACRWQTYPQTLRYVYSKQSWSCHYH